MTESEEQPIKIQNAANAVGITHKTLYNWIDAGQLQPVKPGYVLLSDVENTRVRLKTANADVLRKVSFLKPRDDNGRFIILRDE